MDKKKKNQIFVLVVLVIFVANGIAIAFMYAVPSEDSGSIDDEFSIKSIYTRPLSNSEESVFLRNNIVVIKYFYSDDCEGCDKAELMAESMLIRFPEKIIIEKIDAEKYGDHMDELGVEDVPAFYIKGKYIRKLYSDATEDELFSQICSVYYVSIEECL